MKFLNKKSFSWRHARAYIFIPAITLFTHPKTLKVKYPTWLVGFSIINFNVVPDKNAEYPMAMMITAKRRRCRWMMFREDMR